jgi:hypothetical protein
VREVWPSLSFTNIWRFKTSNSRPIDLLREELTQVSKSFELERVSSGIQKEHRRLLANLAFKSGVRFDDKFHASRLNPCGELLPLVPLEHDTEVGDRHFVAVDGIAIEPSLSPRR